MTKCILTFTLLTFGLLTAMGQNCSWSVVKVGKDTVYFLSKPIDIGEKAYKEKLLLQGMIIGSDRLLILNVKNDAIKLTDKITIGSKSGDLIAKAVEVDTKTLIAKTTAIFYDLAKPPAERKTFFSDLESKENKFIFFEITPNDIENFKNAEFLSFKTTDISIELGKSTAKRLKTMIPSGLSPRKNLARSGVCAQKSKLSV